MIETIVKQDTPDQLFLNKLRQRTAHAHAKLEQLPLSANLTSGQPSVARYVNYLEVMYKVISDIERRVFPVVRNEVPDLQHRHKTRMLTDDLLALNGKAEAAEVFVAASAHMDSLPFAMGIMYVIEGSTLGGRVILKHMQPVLEATTSRGFSYFAGYGVETGARWKAFLQALTTFATTKEHADEEIIAGAIFAFDIIHNLLKAAGNHESN